MVEIDYDYSAAIEAKQGEQGGYTLYPQKA